MSVFCHIFNALFFLSCTENCGAKTGVYKRTTVAIGSYPANPWGLYDMTGNVWEWTCSAYVEDYDGREKQCVSKNDVSTLRVLRGGSWNYSGRFVRSAIRSRFDAGNRNNSLGFRLALGQTAS
jgi:formylglycine-generating enzyme required for sulfatase activity